MKWKTIVVIGLVALAGCGGDDDDSSSDGAADQGAAASTAPAEPAEPINGKYTEEKVLKAAGLTKTGDGYTWDNDCDVAAIAWDKAGVKALKEEVGARAVQTNKSGTVAFQLSTTTLKCGLKASAVLRSIP